MMNDKRIVPILATDLLTMYGTMMKLAGTSVTAVSAEDTGVFVLSSGSGNLFADEPVKSFDFGSVSSAVVYFVAAYDFEGFKVDGVDVTPTMSPSTLVVNKDARTLYTATISSGTVTIAQKGF